jgi:hypothetical protein
MIASFSLICVVTGGVLAVAADRFPEHTKMLQFSGGALLVAGLALLGSKLPCFVC